MERLFRAIDTAAPGAARTLAGSLAGVVGGVKLGAAFVVENGRGGVAAVAEAGLPVWLDLKLLEIPGMWPARCVRRAHDAGRDGRRGRRRRCRRQSAAANRRGDAAGGQGGRRGGRAPAPISCASRRASAPSGPGPTTGRAS